MNKSDDEDSGDEDSGEDNDSDEDSDNGVSGDNDSGDNDGGGDSGEDSGGGDNDGELVLDNSPLHQYLQSIGFSEQVEILARNTPPIITQDTDHVTLNQPIITQDTDNVTLNQPIKEQDSMCNPILSKLCQCVRLILSKLAHCHFLRLNKAQIVQHCYQSLVRVHQDHLEHLTKQPITTQYTGHLTLNQPITAQYTGHLIYLNQLKDVMMSQYVQLNLLNVIMTLCLSCTVMILSYLISSYLISWSLSAISISLSVIVITHLFYQYHYKVDQIKILEHYINNISSFKKSCKTILSYLRDAQVAKSNYLSGVTWSKLDTIERGLIGGSHDHLLELGPVRAQLFHSLCAVAGLHRNVILSGLDCFSLGMDVDNRARYLTCQDGIEDGAEGGTYEDGIEETDGAEDGAEDGAYECGIEETDGAVTSQLLRKHLKIAEHLISELLWKMCVGCYNEVWVDSPPTTAQNKEHVTGHMTSLEHSKSSQHLNFFLSSLEKINTVIEAEQSTLTHVFDSFTNSQSITPVSVGPQTQAKAQSDVSLQIQYIHSSLNVATLRSLQVYQSISSTGAATAPISDLHLTEVCNDLELLKMNVDLSSNSIEKCIETINKIISKRNNNDKHFDIISTASTIENTEDCSTDLPMLVPYTQTKNEIYSGINTGVDDVEREERLSDDEGYRIKHKKDSRFLMMELKHVIDTEPTTLYDEDYEDFRESGMLNPTKRDIDEMKMLEKEEGQEEEAEEEEKVPALNLGMFCKPLQGSWMDECVIVGEGEASSEEEEEASSDDEEGKEEASSEEKRECSH